MELLTPDFDIDAYFETVRTAPERVLMLDYDGTLAPFKVQRNQAVPYEGVERLLDGIMTTGQCRVVIVSGRWTRDILQLIQLKKRPEIWGSHGWEHMLPDGSCTVAEIDETALKVLADIEDWLRGAGLYQYCEPKPACLALHWRGKPQTDIERIRSSVMEECALMKGADTLHLTEFDGGLEFRVPGRTKGLAVNEILRTVDPDACVAYLGDDLTDEDAFKALGSRGLRVLVRDTLRSTAADIRLNPPDELLSFLKRWQECCSAV